MRAEFISRFGNAGPMIELRFDTQAELIAWESLLSKAENGCRLTVLNDGIDGPHPTCLIGAWSNILEIKGTVTVGKSPAS